MSLYLPFTKASVPLTLWEAYEEFSAMPLAIVGEKNGIAQANLLMLSMDDEEKRETSVGHVESFIRALFADRCEQLRNTGGRWAVYAWHDAMAGQLRISVCPADGMAELPFQCDLKEVDESTIARRFLMGSSIIPWSALELRDTTGNDLREDMPRSYQLEVCAMFVG